MSFNLTGTSGTLIPYIFIVNWDNIIKYDYNSYLLNMKSLTKQIYDLGGDIYVFSKTSDKLEYNKILNIFDSRRILIECNFKESELSNLFKYWIQANFSKWNRKNIIYLDNNKINLIYANSVGFTAIKIDRYLQSSMNGLINNLKNKPSL